MSQDVNGEYIVLGSSTSSDGDLTANHGSNDYWLIKLDSVGNKKWQKNYGGSDSDVGTCVTITKDRGFILTGYSVSSDGDVLGNHGGSFDFWVLKLDSSGGLGWNGSYGGNLNDEASSVIEIPHGYLVSGMTASSDGDLSGNYGGSDYWIVQLDTVGNLKWQKNYGGTLDDIPGTMQRTLDGGIVIVGMSESNDTDVSGSHGGQDYWIVKLSEINGKREFTNDNNIQIYPNPSPSGTSINISTTQPISKVAIADCLGGIFYSDTQTVKAIKNGIDMPGLYFVTIFSGGKSWTQKLIIE